MATDQEIEQLTDQRVIAHTTKAMTADELAAALDKVSRPVSHESVPLQFDVDYNVVF